jgi:hypothetical protein
LFLTVILRIYLRRNIPDTNGKELNSYFGQNMCSIILMGYWKIYRKNERKRERLKEGKEI